jgi:hypothetical protein
VTKALAFLATLVLTVLLAVRIAVATPQSLPGGMDDLAPADAGAPAEGGPPQPASAPKTEAPSLTRVDIQGYVNLGVSVTSRPRALPRDRFSYDLRSSVAGLIIRGTPFEQFSYTLHFGVNPAPARIADAVEIVDQNGNGSAEGVAYRYRYLTLFPVEEVSIAYSPADWFQVKGGHFYMPFSPGASVLVTAQMFPARPGPTQVFMTGADWGLMASTALLERRMLLSFGVFNGSSLGLGDPATTSLGPALNLFFDVHPLGRMPRAEGDPQRGPFRFALGGGTIYRNGVLFDRTGYESTRFREVRLDVALRASVLGFFLQGEILRRLQTDDLSARPSAATGAYVQASYFQPLSETFAIAPIARYGVSEQDQQYFPRTIKELEVGMAFYPRADLAEPNRLRFILQYDGEFREPEDDVAHAGVFHGQLRW